MSIQSTSLAHYFGKALILPSRFYKNRPSDIQNINSDCLVLSKKKFLNDSNCSIELILDNEEVNYLTKLENNNTFLYSKPIPISRVKKVYFINEVQKLKTIDNINKGIGFISAKIIEVIGEDSININTSNNYNNKYSSELESKIKTYNNILGGLSFVRYTLDGEYTKNYFSILSHFNGSIEKKNRLSGYDGAFTHKGKVWNKLSPLIYKNISEDDVKRYAKEEDITIEKSNGVFKYENINNKTITYKLTILNTYGEKSSNRKKTNDLIFDCKNEKIPKDIQEGISLIYGINNGYSSFRNQYDKKIVKFKMDSLLDYYTIESVFQYVINEQKNNQKFEYIDENFSDDKSILDIQKENKETISPVEKLKIDFQEFKILFDKEITKKDKEIEELRNKIEELEKYNKNINSKLDEEKEKINIERDLYKLTVKDLKEIAKDKNIKGRSKMRKHRLIEAIENDNS
jgi:hypothetical protein